MTNKAPTSGILYVVATPIGNLEDLAPRARQTLASVDLVAAEDTRHTGRLLSTIGAKPRQMALHDHNEAQVVERVIQALESGKNVALVSDAGTPLLSDPGYRLVREAHARNVAVVPVPGASAVTAALSVAGLPTDRFCFEGFPPAKRTARREWLRALAAEQRTLVFYESVHRIRDCVADLADVFGKQRDAYLGRELTKLHEQCVHATLGELCERLDDDSIPAKGEFVLVVAGAPHAPSSAVDVDRLLAELAGRLPAKEVARIAASVTGLRRNDLYQRVLSLRNDS
ncbi:MAG: 16S rRNA (cytidine(1402)-2'-O)-methyltransferase [Woeseiaceae bacterium]|nr:16S rRNA (cytidine(1402)-2'-O)-methyltransferase [Woeseiaceae bacterium]